MLAFRPYFIILLILVSGCSTSKSVTPVSAPTLESPVVISPQPVPQAEITPAPLPAIPAQPESDEIVISAVGDIMLDGTSRPILAQNGYDYPFEKVRSLFEGSDAVIGNLEGPLTDRGTQEPDKTFTFRTPPEPAAAALKKAGFNVVSLANNHTLDYGAEGLAQTIETLDRHKILFAGGGANLEQARTPAIIEAKGQRIAVLAYSMTLPENFYAGKNRPGTAFGHESHVRADVTAARKQADIVVVVFHWGQERKTELREYQTKLGRLAIDSGAQAVVGHHPHILQGVERYKDGVIMYSLGNFTFGSYSMSSARSAIARLTFRNARLHSAQLFPLNVNNFEVQFQPKPLQGKQAEIVIENVQVLSRELGTTVRSRNDVAHIELDKDEDVALQTP